MVIIYGWSSALEETSAKTFSVIHNTFDPAEFGTKGGAALNSSETSEEIVDAFTICIRFQGRWQSKNKILFFKWLFAHDGTFVWHDLNLRITPK